MVLSDRLTAPIPALLATFSVQDGRRASIGPDRGIEIAHGIDGSVCNIKNRFLSAYNCVGCVSPRRNTEAAFVVLSLFFDFVAEVRNHIRLFELI